MLIYIKGFVDIFDIDYHIKVKKAKLCEKLLDYIADKREEEQDSEDVESD